MLTTKRGSGHGRRDMPHGHGHMGRARTCGGLGGRLGVVEVEVPVALEHEVGGVGRKIGGLVASLGKTKSAGAPLSLSAPWGAFFHAFFITFSRQSFSGSCFSISSRSCRHYRLLVLPRVRAPLPRPSLHLSPQNAFRH
jgi:hypothetical protein